MRGSPAFTYGDMRCRARNAEIDGWCSSGYRQRRGRNMKIGNLRLCLKSALGLCGSSIGRGLGSAGVQCVDAVLWLWWL